MYLIGGVSPILITILGFFIKKWIESVSVEIVNLKKDVQSLNLGMNLMQSELSNATKDLAEFKGEIRAKNEDYDKRIERLWISIVNCQKDVLKLEIMQDNCPARNRKIE
jgi:hypothetical protein